MAVSPDSPQGAEQELRLAVVMTGGVSLAIWMGGVAAELDQLVRAPDASPSTPEQTVYAELLELARYVPRVDVVSGTSAGGVNGALLAAAVARRKPLTRLRDLWLDVASFSALLRSPYAKDPPSLLKGDDYFTTQLQSAFRDLLGEERIDEQPGDHPVELRVTTTLLNGEDSRLVDDFGTLIPDVRHNGIFRFDRELLRDGPKLARRLALASRSSASFPVAFEPSWVPCAGEGDEAHPPMTGIADFRSDHFVIDGGVLVNRPVEPALRAMFAMPADTEDVCRVLLYVVPDPGESVEEVSEKQDEPPTLGDVALRSLVTIPRVQSIAHDLERLKEHNAQVAAQQEAREHVLEHWFPHDLDREIEPLLPGYCRRRAVREAENLIAELTRRWPEVMALDFEPLDRQLLSRRLQDVILERLPRAMPSATAPTAEQVGEWGIDSLERAATVTLDLARRGHGKAPPGSGARKELAEARASAHAALARLRRIRRTRRDELKPPAAGQAPLEWMKATLDKLRDDDPAVRETALDIAGALRQAAGAVRDLGDDRLAMLSERLAPRTTGEPPITVILRHTVRALREMAEPDLAAVVEELTPAGGAAPVATVAAGECLRRLLALEVLQDAVGLTTPVVEQRVKLLQVSANTRDAFDAKRRAAEKLTGLHLGHFGAFYKPSWRANDWMWGRLDAAGWLAQLLLEPSRIEERVKAADDPAATAFAAIRKIALGPPGDAHDWLERELDGATMKGELAWLEPGSGLPQPTALPACSLAVARRIQLSILATELPGVDAAVRLDEAGEALSQTGRDFRAVWNGAGGDAPPEHLQRGLRACNFAATGFEGERDSGLLARGATGAAATTASALSGAHSGLPELIAKSKITSSARGLALAVHGLVDSAIRRSPMAFATMIGAMAAGGAMLAAAVVAAGSQPVLTGAGFTILLAGWIVGLWRSQSPWRYALISLGVAAVCAAIALIPSFVSLLEACPKNADGTVSDCFRGDVEDAFNTLEPVFIVVALLLAAVIFGARAGAPKQ